MTEQVGKYQLIRKLATGGMAEVFLAKAAGPMGFEKTLVLKRILPHLAEEATFVEMFLSEAKLAAQLTHPNIVQIFDFGEADGAYFLAMEYIDGPHLRALVKGARTQGRPLSPVACARIISLACEGLAFAHDFADPQTGEPMGLIHRDISPDNILMSRQGAVKVVDFGIAKAASQSHHTQSGVIKGKLAYMPPEQVRAKTLDRRADVYALGVVLYELLTMRRPFESSSDAGLMQAILFEEPVPASQHRAGLPELLLGILGRALAKDREQRYPDCLAFQSDLEDFILSAGKPVTTQQLAQLVAQLTAGTGTPVPLQNTPRAKAPPSTTPVHTPVPASIPDLPSAAAWAEPPTLKTPRPLEPAAESRPPAPPKGPRKVAAAAPAVPPEAPPAPAMEAPEPRPRTRRWIPALAGGALLAAAAAILLGRAGTQAPPPPAITEVLPSKVTPPEAQPPQDEPPPVPSGDTQTPLHPVDTDPPPPGDTATPPLSGDNGPSDPKPVPDVGPSQGSGPSTPKDTKVKTKRQPAAPKPVQKGTLEFRVRPYATVFIDGKKVGDTPMPAVELPAGTHVVKLTNPDLAKTVTRTVLVKPQEPTILKVNLLEE
ncbi:serine/threonine protein kinase [Stigmatella aurantiaca]|uniref:Serine/threonine protein kinase n=1 Tax=Stigmatella aurantiaca TaxID=41 RepID=A0A1H7LZ97_STIAU|nr:serine/threonine-protein kinase [Stigmatella aurantiaca]SEL04179.1 serine/threonine protein kinase [Stigmatella aurantiaca]